MTIVYKVSENLYMGTCTFFQYFEGRSGDAVVYIDYAQKEVDVYIQRVTDGPLGYYWDMKFGDITLMKVKKGKVVKYITDLSKMEKELGVE